MDVSQEIGIQFACFWFGSLRIVSLRGESVSFSLVVEEVDEMKSEEAMGIEIDNWVLSDCESSSGQEMVGRSD